LGKLSTTINIEPNLTPDQLFIKFPEFRNNIEMFQVALDYVATLKSGKYKTEQELNSKFPEIEFIQNSNLALNNRVNKAITFYHNLINDGYTIESLGTEEEFIVKISDSLHSSNLYDQLLKAGYTSNTLGSKNEFIKTFFVAKSLKEIEIEKQKNIKNEEIAELKLKNQAITYFTTKDISQICLCFFLISFCVLYLIRPLILFTKGLFAELK
jgi:hypothetical protein